MLRGALPPQRASPRPGAARRIYSPRPFKFGSAFGITSVIAGPLAGAAVLRYNFSLGQAPTGSSVSTALEPDRVLPTPSAIPPDLSGARCFRPA